MVVKSLVENRGISSNWQCAHGLSLYVETANHRLLFDLGPGESIINNALEAGVNLAEIDTVILSHGHNDHGGGLGYFLQVNEIAPVYLRSHAFDHHYSLQASGVQKDISIDNKLSSYHRFKLIDEITEIDNELLLFPTTTEHPNLMKSNKNLFKMTNNGLKNDDFDHEQHLLVHVDDFDVLFSGCAHGGILTILEAAKKILNHYPQIVIGGFHLASTTGLKVSPSEIDQLANNLLITGSMFYTCHCTGYEAYQMMKPIMKDQLSYFATGNVLLL